MQDFDEIEHVFLICAEFEVKIHQYKQLFKENNFKPCLTKHLLNMFKLWYERALSHELRQTPKSLPQLTGCRLDAIVEKVFFFGEILQSSGWSK